MHTQFVHVAFSVTVPSCPEPVKFEQWIPIRFSDSVVPAAPGGPPPKIETPERIPAKMPTTVKINGQPRTVPACVAAVLKLIAEGAREVELRPETLAKFRAEVPEVVLVRDPSRKVRSNRAWYGVG